MSDNLLSRATNIEELNEVLEKFWAGDAPEKGLTFKPSPSDIIIAPFH